MKRSLVFGLVLWTVTASVASNRDLPFAISVPSATWDGRELAVTLWGLASLGESGVSVPRLEITADSGTSKIPQTPEAMASLREFVAEMILCQLQTAFLEHHLQVISRTPGEIAAVEFNYAALLQTPYLGDSTQNLRFRRLHLSSGDVPVVDFEEAGSAAEQSISMANLRRRFITSNPWSENSLRDLPISAASRRRLNGLSASWSKSIRTAKISSLRSIAEKMLQRAEFAQRWAPRTSRASAATSPAETLVVPRAIEMTLVPAGGNDEFLFETESSRSSCVIWVAAGVGISGWAISQFGHAVYQRLF
jgi:hypothetical protein